MLVQVNNLSCTGFCLGHRVLFIGALSLLTNLWHCLAVSCDTDLMSFYDIDTRKQRALGDGWAAIFAQNCF